MAESGLPIDWKYVVATIFSDMHHSMQFDTARSREAMSRSAGLSEETKSDASKRGNGGTVDAVPVYYRLIAANNALFFKSLYLRGDLLFADTQHVAELTRVVTRVCRKKF